MPTPKALYRIYNPAGCFMGTAVFQEDAANWASTLGEGATIRMGRTTLYTIPVYGDGVDFVFHTTREEATV